MDSIGTDAYTATMPLGERVRTQRLERGWSQQELGRRANLDGQTVFRIEHGKSNGSLTSRSKLARALGIPLAALDSDIPYTKESATHDRAFSIALASLTEQQLIEGIAGYVKELERRKSGSGGQDPPPASDAPSKPSPRPRRHR